MIELLRITVILYGLLPLLLLLALKRKVSKEVTYLEPFIWFVALGSLYEFIFTILLKVNSDYWLRFNKIAAFALIAYFFYHLLHKRYTIFYILLSVAYCLFYFGLLYFLWKRSDNLLTNAYLSIFQLVVVLFFAILWFRNLFIELYFDSLLRNPAFYFVSGLLLFYSGSAFLYLLSDALYKQARTDFANQWILIMILLNFIFRTLLIFGICKGRTK